MKEPNEKTYSVYCDDDDSDDASVAMFVLFLPIILKIILALVCTSLFLLAIFVWNISIKDILEKILAIVFVVVVIYALTITVDKETVDKILDTQKDKF